MDRNDLVRQLSQEMALGQELEKPQQNENHYISATGTLLADAEKYEREQRQRQEELEMRKARKTDPWEILAGSLAIR